MNESTSNHEHDRLIALLGLALDRGEPPGDPPDLAEVDQWRRGELDEPRALEVRIHLLRSPGSHALLRQLERDERELEALQKELQQEQHAALLGLALESGELPGSGPDLAEIDQWRRGELDELRAGEVQAYLLRDTNTREMLRRLEAEEREIIRFEEEFGRASTPDSVLKTAKAKEPAEPREGLLQRLWHLLLGDGVFGFGGVMATGIAMLFLAVVGLRMLHDPALMELVDQGYGQWDYEYGADAGQWPWRRPDQTKAVDFWQDPVPPVPEKLAFSVGVRQGLEQLAGEDEKWSTLIAQLPWQIPGCKNVSDGVSCEKRLELLRASGRWSALLQLQCGRGERVEDSFWSMQMELVGRFGAELSAAGSEANPYAYYFSHWPKGKDQQDSLCAGVSGLLDLGIVYR